MLTPDLCIIGAGSAGLSLAAGAAQMGARVVLIEGGEMGGDCLNAGCVPSKALLAAAAQAESRRRGAALGIAAARAEVDFAAVKDHIARVIAAIAPHDSQERFEGLGVTVLRDWARFEDARTVLAAGQRIRARRFVIATGSQPFIPPIPGLADLPYLTNETIFGLRQAPGHLIVLGGGPIGVEMAQAHRRLGCTLTLIEAGRCLPRDDREAAGVVVESLRAEGVRVLEGQPVTRLEGGEGGSITAVLGDGTVVTGSHLLLATGRRVALERLNLDGAGIAHDAKGVRVDARLRSVTNRRVFAMGDAVGGLQFTHLAGAHAGVVLRQSLLSLPARAPALVPWVTYGDPELAQIGPTEEEARARHGAKVTVIRIPFSGNDRAQAEGATAGFLKLVVLGGRPIGATLVGPHAGDLIGLWALAISQRLKLSAIAGLILPYPTRGEIAKRAAGAYYSPRLFDSPWIKRLVRLVQGLLP